MSISEVVDGYTNAWNEADPKVREWLIEECWAGDGIYCDPTGKAEGRHGLSNHIAAMQANMPDHRIEMTSGIDEHDGYLRFTWRLVGPGGTNVMEGMDFGQVDGEGRLIRITGFFGPLPELPEG
ncbi:MAG: nuclear transport factor 2 family protein [Acidimicrobiales bacterium]